MKISEHLDRISKLGFWITINWNEDFEIFYNANDVYPSTAYAISILKCSYYKSQINPYSFQEMIEVCCDLFYSWYNKNLELIKDFDIKQDNSSMETLEEHCLGEITKIVARELNLTDILKIFPNSDWP